MGQQGSREAQAPRADGRQEDAHSAPRQSTDESTAAPSTVKTEHGVVDKVVTAVLAAVMVSCIVCVGDQLGGYFYYVFIAAASVTFPVAFTVPQFVEAFCGAPKSAPALRVLPDGAKVRFWPDHQWETFALGLGIGFVWGVALGIRLAHMKGIKVGNWQVKFNWKV